MFHLNNNVTNALLNSGKNDNHFYMLVVVKSLLITSNTGTWSDPVPDIPGISADAPRNENKKLSRIGPKFDILYL